MFTKYLIWHFLNVIVIKFFRLFLNYTRVHFKLLRFLFNFFMLIQINFLTKEAYNIKYKVSYKLFSQ